PTSSLSPDPTPLPSCTFPYTTLFRSRVPQLEVPAVFGHRPGLGQHGNQLEWSSLVGNQGVEDVPQALVRAVGRVRCTGIETRARSEEHTSELQSRGHLVCRLLLEKKK